MKLWFFTCQLLGFGTDIMEMEKARNKRVIVDVNLCIKLLSFGSLNEDIGISITYG